MLLLLLYAITYVSYLIRNVIVHFTGLTILCSVGRNWYHNFLSHRDPSSTPTNLTQLPVDGQDGQGTSPWRIYCLPERESNFCGDTVFYSYRWMCWIRHLWCAACMGGILICFGIKLALWLSVLDAMLYQSLFLACIRVAVYPLFL